MSDKLDRLVAEKVMGWTVRECDPDDNDYERYNSGWAVCKWCPSTDIAAAMEVADTLERTEKKWLFKLVRRSGDTEPRCLLKWACEFRRSDELDFRYAIAAHESRSVAICMAALQAVGVPESEIQEAMR